MSIAPALMTVEEFWGLPAADQLQELVSGEVRNMAPAGGEHGMIGADMIVQLGHYVRQNKLGAVFNSDTGFVLARDPDTVRCADCAFVSQARIAAEGVPQKFFPGPPDVAVEVVSPNDTVYEVDEKVQQWLAAGVRLVIVLNPRQKTATVHRPGEVRILTVTDTIDGAEVVPGFRCAVKELFRDCR